MVAAFVDSLRRPISSVRLESYRPVNGTDLDMLATYLWNIELSEALYPTLEALEISFRNAVHEAASIEYDSEYWFDQPGVLLSWQREQIADARADLTAKGKAATDGRIVAAVTFGFWTSLLNSPFERAVGPGSRNRLAWYDNNYQPTHLNLLVFPSIPHSQNTRAKLFDRFRSARDLRNRVFHHEPIWVRSNLAREYRRIQETIEWISPEMKQLVSFCDRFGDINGDARDRIEDEVRAIFGGP